MNSPKPTPPRPARSRTDLFIGAWLAITAASFAAHLFSLVRADILALLERGAR